MLSSTVRRAARLAAAALAAAAVLPAVSALPPAAASGRAAIVLTDDTGATVTLPRPARRVVSLISSDTQIMLALGLRRRLVGVDLDSLRYMAAPYDRLVQGLPSIGDTYPAPSLERILKARPDLILSSGAVAGNAKLRSLGIPVLVLNPANLAGIERDVRLVGEATGASAAAGRVVARIAAAAAAVARIARRAGTHPSVYVEIGVHPYYSVGPGSYIDDLLRLLGARNAVDRVARVPYPQLSSEAVVALDPQVIVLDETGVTPGQVASRPGWQAVAAVVHHRVYDNVDPNALSEPGPAVVTALWQLAHDLYPGVSP
ncbi:MAG: ABC transporter substrate-binding protein [Firmicutes bacterium]|nr:ABC transporter substrate-binding protein [Bacillota bacterium]